MLTEQLISYILHKLPGQTFSVRRVRGMWTAGEAERFEKELEYLAEHYPLEMIGEGYVRFTLSVMEETKYFKAHGDYRNHSFAEANERVYADQEQTTYYMLGLSVTEYLWETVLRIHRFYESVIREAEGEKYLEIGPGHGKYFREAYELGRFKKYVAIDVSPTAIAMTEEYMHSENMPGGGVLELLCQDATQIDTEEKYDFIVVQEVLEHLEDPEGMLRKIGELLSPEGRGYALMPICAPSPQHIFLFRDREHVRSIVERAGLEIVKEEYITANNMPVETAEAKRLPINAALIVKRKK